MRVSAPSCPAPIAFTTSDGLLAAPSPASASRAPYCRAMLLLGVVVPPGLVLLFRAEAIVAPLAMTKFVVLL